METKKKKKRPAPSISGRRTEGRKKPGEKEDPTVDLCVKRRGRKNRKEAANRRDGPQENNRNGLGAGKGGRMQGGETSPRKDCSGAKKKKKKVS